MRPTGPTFWQLDGQIGWLSAETERSDLSVSHSGLRLPADAGGPLSLAGNMDSLGGLTLPQGMALTDQFFLYLLVGYVIKRFDSKEQSFVTLPAVGGQGPNARQFQQPRNIAAVAHSLIVADTGNNRVQVFDTRSLSLTHVWQLRDWRPVDVTAHRGSIYILDGRYGRVYRYRPGYDDLTLVVKSQAAEAQEKRWTRLTLDRQGKIYILDQHEMHLSVFDAGGHPLAEEVTGLQPEDVRDRFEPPQIMLDADGRFCLPPSLTLPCPGPSSPPDAALPLFHCPPWSDGGLLFDRQGQEITINDPADGLRPYLYTRSGLWFSSGLDSQIYNCQWDRLAVDVGTLPSGSQLQISTFTAADQKSDQEIAGLPEAAWERSLILTGAIQPPPGTDTTDPPQTVDGLVQSRQGRYLWLRAKLIGDGFATPVIKAIRAHYPRTSYLEYLPAVFSDDEEGRWFLERFLAIFKAEWDQLETHIEHIERYFDPQAVPEKEALAYLAGWLALPLEGVWSETQKRNMLVAAPQIYANRGTPQSLRHYLQVYLQNITGLTPQEQGSYPCFVEGFRERDYFMLTQAQLGRNVPLWGPTHVGRLQLDVFAREGEVRLVSTGEPQQDYFDAFAHRFRIFIPASWVRTAAARRMIDRAVHSEKPAHTEVTITLVHPRLRVGRQASIGLNTIIGGYPQMRLGCQKCIAGRSFDETPRNRLGYDTLISAGAKTHAGLVLESKTRMGVDTVL
ncbi:MAG: phage tail protein [Candidatus Promineifilaceae bacterium]|nr:phage tail protein [Candidatus Promineifilaceae bacterium]